MEDNVELSNAVNILGVVRMVLSLKIQRTANMLEVTLVKFVLCLLSCFISLIITRSHIL